MTINLANILDRKILSSQKTRNGISEHLDAKFSGAACTHITDWKISQFYLLKRLESVSFLFSLCLTQFLKARDFGWIHLQRNSHSHHIYSLEFVRLKEQKVPQAKVMAIHHSNHKSVYEVDLFSPDSSHMFHLRHAIACKLRKRNHLRQQCHNKQYIAK